MKPKKWAQEKRTLGTTAGGSTYMLTLPKAWIEAFELEKGHELPLSLVGEGVYINLGQHSDEDSKSTSLKIDENLTGEVLARTLISRYIAGFNVLEINGTLSVSQRDDIRETVQRLIGAEILQETSELMLIHILRDPQVLSVAQLLEYISDNVISMLRDAPQSLFDQDTPKALSVIQRDERVDRFFLLMSRRLYAALRDPLAEVEHKISRVDFFNTHNVARQLERVADHAVKIAQSTQVLNEEEREFPKKMKTLLENASEGVQDFLAQVGKAFVDSDSNAAHQALALKPEVEALIADFDRRLLELDDSLLAYHLGIVADSISRVKDYAANIGEVALNAVALESR
jgi:phosphate uptake regulator